MAAAAPSPQELEELRRQLRAYAASSLEPEDADDAVQTALLRVVADERPSELPFRQRAFRKLKDVRAEFFRRPQRAFNVAIQPLDEEQPGVAQPDSAIALLETLNLVESAVGPDVLAYARLKAIGSTDADIASQLGWTSKKVAAARKKLSRNRTQLAQLIDETLT